VTCLVRMDMVAGVEYFAMYYANAKLNMIVNKSDVEQFCKLLGVKP
jgi:hypothetical protein